MWNVSDCVLLRGQAFLFLQALFFHHPEQRYAFLVKQKMLSITETIARPAKDPVLGLTVWQMRAAHRVVSHPVVDGQSFQFIEAPAEGRVTVMATATMDCGATRGLDYQ